MAKSSLRLLIGIQNAIFEKIQTGTYTQGDFIPFVSKFEEKIFPLLKLVYQKDHQTAKECHQKGEDIETIEEYLMVILCMLVVKGFGDLSRNVSQLESLEFDLDVDEEDSENLEKCIEIHPYDLKEALNEHVLMKADKKEVFLENREDDIKERKDEPNENDFPEYEGHETEISDADYESSPRMVNNLYHQETKDFKSSDTFNRTKTNTQYSESRFNSKEDNLMKRENELVLTKVETILQENGEIEGKSKF